MHTHTQPTRMRARIHTHLIIVCNELHPTWSLTFHDRCLGRGCSTCSGSTTSKRAVRVVRMDLANPLGPNSWVENRMMTMLPETTPHQSFRGQPSCHRRLLLLLPRLQWGVRPHPRSSRPAPISQSLTRRDQSASRRRRSRCRPSRHHPRRHQRPGGRRVQTEANQCRSETRVRRR
jgi:hypothetical protein